MPGVIDAFADDAYCMEKYREMRDAYDRLCHRLGVTDEDADVEIIINSLMTIEREIAYAMYEYGAKYGKGQ